MPVTVQGPDGNTYQFPDGTDKAAAISYFKKKGIGASQPSQPSLDLSNPQHQGTYQMQKGGQTVGVPYGQVQQAAQMGYGFADDQDRWRYAKDNAADSNRTTQFTPAAGDPRASLDYQQQQESNLPAAMQVVGGMAKAGATLAKPATDVIGASLGMSPDAINRQTEAHGGIQTTAKGASIGAALIPAAIEAPVATAGALLGGTAGTGAGQIVGSLAGLTPTQTQLLSDATGLAGGFAGGMGAKPLTAKVGAYLRPKPSPSIVAPTEMAARNLASVILPDTKDASNFIQAAQQEVPNVIRYAQDTGNPLNTQLEFAKAAKGYAQQVLDLKAKIEDPVQNQLVRTTGTGFGSRMNEGPDTYATIGGIDKRIAQLNTQLDAPAANADDARRALASRVDLQREAQGLRNILHDALAKASGLAPEQIADIRQRAGRAFELANDTDAAVMKRMQAEGRSDLGPPTQWGQIPGRVVQFARGGPVAIGDRAFQRAISGFPGQPQALPQVTAPTTPAANRVDQLLQLSKQRFAQMQMQNFSGQQP